MAAGLDLGKQIGPLPLGMWIVIGAGGLGLGYVINKNMAKNAAAASEPSNSQLTESGVGTGGGQFIYEPPQSGSQDQTPETNQSWGIKVTNWLTGPPQSFDPIAADQAVRKYLSGLALTVPEKAMMNMAIIRFGVPPEPLPPTEEPETPTPNAPTAPGAAVVGLHVNRGTLRNEVVWIDTANPAGSVDYYVINAQNLNNGKSIQTTVQNIPGPYGTYSWTHVASPVQGVKTIPYKYTVTPHKGTMAGPSSSTNAVMTL